MSLVEKYNEQKKTLEQMKKDLATPIKEEIKQTINQFLQKYDGVVASVFWTQYTPYFNDGENCEFGVCEMNVNLVVDENPDYYEGSTIYTQLSLDRYKEDLALWEQFEKDPLTVYNELYSKNWYNHDSVKLKTAHEIMKAEWKPTYYSKEELQDSYDKAVEQGTKYPDLEKDFKELVEYRNNVPEDLLEFAFGDHCRVVFTKDHLEVEEYDHD